MRSLRQFNMATRTSSTDECQFTSTLIGTGFRLEDFSVNNGSTQVSTSSNNANQNEGSIEEQTHSGTEGPEHCFVGKSASLISVLRSSSLLSHNGGSRSTGRYGENMDLAVTAVREKRMSVRMASKTFNVPKSTIQNRLTTKDVKPVGGQKKFTAAQEEILVDVLRGCAQLGFPLDRKDLVKILVSLAQVKGVPLAKFSNRWYHGFLERCKDISSQLLQGRSMRVEKKWVSSRCDDWIGALENLKNDGYLDDPAGIWCVSEHDFTMSELYRNKGSRYASQEGNADQLTLCLTGNAAGKIVEPFMFYDGEDDVVHDTLNLHRLRWTRTVAGGLREDEILAEYFKLEILPHMLSEKTVIFLDEELYAGSPRLIQAMFESERNIRVSCYPFKQSRRLQPLSRTFSKDIHKIWRDHILLLRSLPQNKDAVTRAHFPSDIHSIVPELKLNLAIPSGMAATGLWPMVPDLVRATIPTPPQPDRPIKRSRKHRREECLIRSSLARLGFDPKTVRSLLSGIRKIRLMQISGESLTQSPGKILLDKVSRSKTVIPKNHVE